MKQQLSDGGGERVLSAEGKQFFAEVQEYDRANISAPLVRKFADEDFVKAVTTIQHIKAVVVKPLEA